MTQKLFVIFSIACLLIGTYAQTEDLEDTYDQLSEVIQTFADKISAGRNTDAEYCLDQLTSETFEDDFGPLMDALSEAGCLNGAQECDFTKLSALFTQLQANAADQEATKKISILVGSIIGSLGGDANCDGSDACEWLGARLGATLICLSAPKEVYEQITTAVVALDETATEGGEVDQDAVDAMAEEAKKVADEVQKAVQVMQGFDDQAVDSLSGVRDQIDVAAEDNSTLHNKPLAGKADALFGFHIPIIDDIIDVVAPPAVDAACSFIDLPFISDICPTVGRAIVGSL